MGKVFKAIVNSVICFAFSFSLIVWMFALASGMVGDKQMVPTRTEIFIGIFFFVKCFAWIWKNSDLNK